MDILTIFQIRPKKYNNHNSFLNSNKGEVPVLAINCNTIFFKCTCLFQILFCFELFLESCSYYTDRHFEWFSVILFSTGEFFHRKTCFYWVYLRRLLSGKGFVYLRYLSTWHASCDKIVLSANGRLWVGGSSIGPISVAKWSN